MKKTLTFLFTLFTLLSISLTGFSQGVTVTVGGISATTTNTDSLGNEAPAFYLDRANHTNTQAQSTIDDLQDSLATKADTSSLHDAVNVSDSLKAGTSDSLLIGVNALVVKTNGQIGINTDTPDPSAILNIESTSKGFLYPRMTTTQRDNIPSPVTGLSVYNTTNDDPNFFNGTDWRRVTHAPSSSLKVGEVIFATGVSSLIGDSANFFWDNSTKRLGIGTGNPSEALEVNGNVKITGDVNSSSITVNGILADSIIALSQATGNIANSMTGMDTVWSAVLDAQRLYITDAGGADSALIYDDGDTTRFESDNPIKIGSGSIIIKTNGDVVIGGKIDAPKDHQEFTATINGSATWQKVAYPSAFPDGSTIIVIATPQDDNGWDYFVRVRSVGSTSFQFMPRNHNGGVYTSAGVIGFYAIRQN